MTFLTNPALREPKSAPHTPGHRPRQPLTGTSSPGRTLDSKRA